MTTYTDAKREQIAQAFKNAKKHLWNGLGRQGKKQEFICLAIRSRFDGDVIDANTAIHIIEQRIGWCNTMSCWLTEQGIPVSQITPRRLQAHRHAWLDMLIAEFSD